jgi:hypothetical protein
MHRHVNLHIHWFISETNGSIAYDLTIKMALLFVVKKYVHGYATINSYEKG